MRLWMLEPVRGLMPPNDPWDDEYDKMREVVVRAGSEAEARDMADAFARESSWGADFGPGEIAVWKDARYTTCVELTAHGNAGIVIAMCVSG